MTSGHDASDHTATGHDDHGHGDQLGHVEPSSVWVVPPMMVGLIVAIVLIVVFGLQSGASPH